MCFSLRFCGAKVLLCGGKVCASDCIPSLVTVPTMLAWAFAYETVDQKTLRLLSGLPKEWYALPFCVTGLGYSEGTLDISSDGDGIEIRFAQAPTKPFALVWRAKDTISPSDIQVGAEYVEEIRGNVLVLKPQSKVINIKIQ